MRRRLIDPILKAQGTPESIARGGSMGIWVALTPTVGIQMAVVMGLAVPLRANVPVAIAMVWITNPLTVVPIYFTFYWFGTLLLGLPSASYAKVARILSDSFRLVQDDGLVAAVHKLSDEILLPLTVGSVVGASLAAVPTYFILLRIFRRRLERKLLAGLEQGALRIVEAELEPRAPAEPPTRDGRELPQPHGESTS